MKIRTKSISREVPVIASVMLIIATMAIGLISFFLYRVSTLNYNQEIALGIANTVAEIVETENYAELIQTKEKDEYWHKLKSEFDGIKENTGVMYLYALNNDVDGKIMFVVEGQTATDDPALICDLGEVLPVGSYTEDLFLALATGEPQTGDAHYVDRFGTMVSGYAPIIDESNNVIGVVGADYNIQTVLDQIRAFGIFIIGISLAASLGFGILLYRYIRRTISQPINKIVDASHDVVAGKMDDIEEMNDSEFVELGALTKTTKELFEKARGIDELTGAYNRKAGIGMLEKLLKTEREKDSVAAFLDIDYLKEINDTYGHQEGDFVIKTISNAIISSIREGDIVCRYGGDEFLVIFNNSTIKNAKRAIERMTSHIDRINESAGKPYRLDFSYGMALIDNTKYSSTEELIFVIDKAMYHHKKEKKEDGDKPDRG